jgi:hypothetical protein
MGTMDMEKTNIIEAAADDAVAAAAVGGAAVAAKKGVDAIKKGLKGLSKQSREEKVDKMFDKPMKQLDKQIEQAKERVSDFVEDKEDADNPNKKEQIQKKIEKAQDVVKKLEGKKRALKEKKRKAKESIFGKLESREHAICSIVLGENFDLDFLKTNIEFLNNKPSKIKEAYKKFINEKESIDENRAVVYNPRMIRAFIKQAEKKFPKYKGEIQQVEKDEIVFPNDPKLKDFFRGAKEVKFVLSDSVEESTLNYGRTLKAIEKERKMKNISDEDKETLAKIAELMASLKENAKKDIEDSLSKFSGNDKKDVENLLKLYIKKDYNAFTKQMVKMDTSPAEFMFELISKADAKFMKKAYPDAKRGEYLRAIMYDRVYGKDESVEEDAISRAKEKADLKKKHDAEIEREKEEIKVIGQDESVKENLKKFIKGAKKKFTAFGEDKEFTFKEYTETLDEKQLAGLKKKADETGIPYGILKKVFDRGMAAWKTGHRPGATPHQWAYARVNSFATKSKGTWGGADKDLAAKVK